MFWRHWFSLEDPLDMLTLWEREVQEARVTTGQRSVEREERGYILGCRCGSCPTHMTKLAEMLMAEPGQVTS